MKNVDDEMELSRDEADLLRRHNLPSAKLREAVWTVFKVMYDHGLARIEIQRHDKTKAKVLIS